jgi:hypothetical protein
MGKNKAKNNGVITIYTSLDGRLLELQFNCHDIMNCVLMPISITYEGEVMTDAAGFNFPAIYMREFNSSSRTTNNVAGKMSAIADGILKSILEILAKFPEIEYIIGYTPNNTIIRDHEFRHGLYYIDEKYRKFCDKTWAEYLSDEEREKVTKHLKDAGYHNKVIKDEFQAYYYSSGENIFGINWYLDDYPKKINKNKDKREVINYNAI